MLLTEMFLPSYKILNILKINSLFKEALATILTKKVICFENKGNIEKMHLQFCKKILKVRNSTPNFTVYGELGRLPLEVMVEQKLVLFWNNMLFNNQKLSSIMYKLMLILHENNPTKFKWILCT